MPEKPGELTHLTPEGHVHMVDVGAKSQTQRKAVARARLDMLPATAGALLDGALAKGDALAVARVAGIMAAKNTAQLIPLCHPLALTHSAVDIAVDPAAGRVDIEVTCSTTGPTGVEMEAMTAASVTALTIYDMVKALERGVRIEGVHLAYKDGGKSGTYRAEPAGATDAP